MSNNTNFYAIPTLQHALPTRSLALKNAGDGGLLTQILYGLIGLGAFLISCGVIVHSAKEIMQDRKIANNPVVLENADIHGNCKGSKIPFLKSCDVTIRNEGKTAERDFSFLAFSSPDQDVTALAQKDDLSNMNIDVAIDKMTNRTLTLGVWGLIGIVGLLWGLSTLKAIPKKQKVKKLFNEPSEQPWQVVALPVRYEHDSLYFDNTIDGITKETNISCYEKKPMFLGAEKNSVVALKAKNSNTFVPLLQNLANIDFNKAEKKVFLDTYNSLTSF